MSDDERQLPPDDALPMAAQEFNPGRRRILTGAAAAGLALATRSGSAATHTARPGLPPPEACGIDHIVVVMMENRSFDHFLGWVPGAEGVQAGRTFLDNAGNPIDSYDLAPDYQGCAFADPAHGYSTGRTHANGDAMDGFLLTSPEGDTFPVGYYTEESLPFYSGCAAHWTICDHYFSGILASTWPNRIYMHAGQTDRANNEAVPCYLPTIWERLADKGVSANYYFHDLPMLGIWGPKLLQYARHINRFHEDAAAGTLPSVSYVDPAFFSEGAGTSRDDHPFADIRDGQVFLNEVYESLINSPQWSRTLMIINYDEWGGFADHVPPPYAPVSEREYYLTGNDGRLGIRVPCVLIGPRARRNHVAHEQIDPNSILNFLAWRFGFRPLGARTDSLNIAHLLDFESAPNTRAPRFPIPAAHYGRACDPRSIPTAERRREVLRRRADHDAELEQLRRMARAAGFDC
jgi:phospholipase C